MVHCEPGPDDLGRVTFTYRKSSSRRWRWRSMTVTADEFIRRFLQHVLPTGFQKLLVAAKPLPVATTPSCPHCGQLMTYLGFAPAPTGSVMIHDSSETKHTRSASDHGAPVLATCGKPAFCDIPHVGR